MIQYQCWSPRLLPTTWSWMYRFRYLCKQQKSQSISDRMRYALYTIPSAFSHCIPSDLQYGNFFLVPTNVRFGLQYIYIITEHVTMLWLNDTNDIGFFCDDKQMCIWICIDIMNNHYINAYSDTHLFIITKETDTVDVIQPSHPYLFSNDVYSLQSNSNICRDQKKIPVLNIAFDAI